MNFGINSTLVVKIDGQLSLYRSHAIKTMQTYFLDIDRD